MAVSLGVVARDAGADADIAVVGAGPAGAAAALLAARRGNRVVLFDRATFPRDKPCGEGLMPSGRPVLRELGLEDALVSDGAPPLQGVKFGLPGQPAMAVEFPEHQGAQTGLGIRRLSFDARLAEAALSEPGVEFHERTAVIDVRTDGPGPITVITSAGEMRVPVVAIADGLRSGLRHRLGRTIGPRPPHRFGIVAHWQTEGPIEPWVRITFADGLEVYEGPVASNQRMVALLCYQSRMREFAGQLESRYREVVLAIRPALARAQLTGPVTAVGPFWYRASTVAERGVFLLGDAAGFTDPITAEGIATGLRQAQAFVAVLASPQPEAAYRRAHRRLTRDPRRVASLLLRLSRTPALVERGLHGHERAPQTLSKLLGVGFGYWGFNRITPREWVRLFSGC
jgi:menaquinone-9 beta-reductase